jgi:hypothetical protein
MASLYQIWFYSFSILIDMQKLQPQPPTPFCLLFCFPPLCFTFLEVGIGAQFAAGSSSGLQDFCLTSQINIKYKEKVREVKL